MAPSVTRETGLAPERQMYWQTSEVGFRAAIRCLSFLEFEMHCQMTSVIYSRQHYEIKS